MNRSTFVAAASTAAVAAATISAEASPSAEGADELKIWTDSDHFVVARSPVDADAIMTELGHPSRHEISDYGYDLKPWSEADSLPSIRFEDVELAGLTVEGGTVSGPAAAWIAAIGRGYIGSLNCCNE